MMLFTSHTHMNRLAIHFFPWFHSSLHPTWLLAAVCLFALSLPKETICFPDPIKGPSDGFRPVPLPQEDCSRATHPRCPTCRCMMTESFKTLLHVSPPVLLSLPPRIEFLSCVCPSHHTTCGFLLPCLEDFLTPHVRLHWSDLTSLSCAFPCLAGIALYPYCVFLLQLACMNLHANRWDWSFSSRLKAFGRVSVLSVFLDCRRLT